MVDAISLYSYCEDEGDINTKWRTGSNPVPTPMPKLGGYELKLSHNVPVVTNGIANAMYVPRNDGATGRKDLN